MTASSSFVVSGFFTVSAFAMAVEALPPIISIFPAHPTAAMATPDVEMHGSDSNSALSDLLGLNALEARSMTPNAYRTYIEADPDKIHNIKGSNPIAWWDNNKDDFPTLH